MVLLPVDSGPIATIFFKKYFYPALIDLTNQLEFIFFSSSFPFCQSPECKNQQDYIIDTCKYEAFHKIEGNRRNICCDPPIPAFYFFSRHQPHHGKFGGRSKCVSPGDGSGIK